MTVINTYFQVAIVLNLFLTQLECSKSRLLVSVEVLEKSHAVKLHLKRMLDLEDIIFFWVGGWSSKVIRSARQHQQSIKVRSKRASARRRFFYTVSTDFLEDRKRIWHWIVGQGCCKRTLAIGAQDTLENIVYRMKLIVVEIEANHISKSVEILHVGMEEWLLVTKFHDDRGGNEATVFINTEQYLGFDFSVYRLPIKEAVPWTKTLIKLEV